MRNEMRKAAIQVAALAGILLVVCVACRLALGNTYMATMPVYRRDVRPADIRVVAETPGVIDHGDARVADGYISVPLQPRGRGATFVELDDGAGNDIGFLEFRVGRFGTIYDVSTGGFTGDSIALVAITVFCLAVAAIMYRAFRRARGPAFYAYATIYTAGFSLFALLTGLLMLVVAIRHLAAPHAYSMLSAYTAISGAGWHFMLVTAPLMLIFAAAMAVSNIALLRHERFRPQNVLGIGVALMLAAGEALAFWLFTRNFSGSEWEGRIRNTIYNVYATGFAYFECMLIGAIICGLKAARHVPEGDVDVILILGCRFRSDGTLTPLLRGRVDKAIEYWRRQRARTGREALLMPSGGQGPDEAMPEAEAMRRYLLEQGVPAERIAVEDRSRNTYQNMEYSRAIIERAIPKARVAYVTTNYHVFRSGVWASLAGLPAEGLGSRTKWWYWPNAFMRECAGLMKNRFRQELLLLAAMLAFFGALSMALR